MYLIKAPPAGVKINIFSLKLVAIMLAIHHAGSLPQPPHYLLIWTDSLDLVAVLNSLHTSKPLHNAPLLAIAGIIFKTGMDLWVQFIEGKLNTHADMLSHLLVDEYQRKILSNCIKHFTPPRERVLLST